MTMQPTIVVVAYNRSLSLKRLLNSLGNADYGVYNDINLIISIDKSGSNEVILTANKFEWKNGKKIIIQHPANLGLRNHIISCGDLTKEYDSVIILEDDLFVSPQFYKYSIQALEFYKDDPQIAGISLYTYRVNAIANLFFLPIEDGYDNYFIQFASSLGQIWTRTQWQGFKNWYAKNQIIPENISIPISVRNWSKQSWKKYYIAYLVSANKYFVFPRISLTTNFSSDAGTHLSKMMNNNFQVPLLLRQKIFNLSAFDESVAVYDAYFEIKGYCIKILNNELNEFDFECDFYGTKQQSQISTAFLISIRNCKNPLLTFGLFQIPLELNVIFNQFGNDITLSQKENFNILSAEKRNLIATNLHYKFRLKYYFIQLYFALKERISHLLHNFN